MFCCHQGLNTPSDEGKMTNKSFILVYKIGLNMCFGAAGSNGESELLGATFERFYLMTLLATLSLSGFPS